MLTSISQLEISESYILRLTDIARKQNEVSGLFPHL